MAHLSSRSRADCKARCRSSPRAGRFWTPLTAIDRDFLPRPARHERAGASGQPHQGKRLGQSERWIHPTAPVRLARLPDESGVPVVVSGCAVFEASVSPLIATPRSSSTVLQPEGCAPIAWGHRWGALLNPCARARGGPERQYHRGQARPRSANTVDARRLESAGAAFRGCRHPALEPSAGR